MGIEVLDCVVGRQPGNALQRIEQIARDMYSSKSQLSLDNLGGLPLVSSCERDQT